MTTYTTKLGLTVHAMDDELDAMRANWNRLDQTFSGVIWVPPDTIPSNDVLFDGAMVAELSTGKVWRAQANASGTYDQHWIKYPWQISAFAKGNFGSVGINDLGIWGYNDIDASQCVNSGLANLVSNSVQVPVGGLYVGTEILRWESTTFTDGLRSIRRKVNAHIDTNNTETIYKATAYNGMVIHSTKITANYQAGDMLTTNLWQSSTSGVLMPVGHHLRLQLLRVNK